MALMPPTSGLIAMRIGQEFGPPEEFASSLARALERGGERGATIVAVLDRGDLATHIPHVDGPSWNTVPLVHLRRGQQPSAEDWALANAIVERMERYR
jgi:hypothetical protein